MNIGVESGLDEALALMNKNYTAKEARDELLRLKAAGFDYGLNVILGAAGAERRLENAEATAELLNAARPFLIFTGTVHAEPGCPLYEDMQCGAFTEPTFGEYLEEEEALLERLALEDPCFFGAHPSYVLPMRGVLARDKEAMLNALREMRIRMGSKLNEHPIRTGEGGIINRR